MYDSIPRGRGARTHAHTDLAAECAAALGVTLDTFARAVAEARDGGDVEAIEAAGSAMIALAENHDALRRRSGRAPSDPTRAAAFRRGRRRERDAAGRRQSALARCGDGLQWQEQVKGNGRYRECEPALDDDRVRALADRCGITASEALRRVTIRWCLRRMARERWPAEHSGGAWRRRTLYVRERLAALGYWPDLRAQVYLPAPVTAATASPPRRVAHHGCTRQRVRVGEHAWRLWWACEVRRGQLGFAGAGWEVAA